MENTVLLPQELHLSLVREVFARLAHLVEFRGYERITLDASELRLAFAEAMVPIVCRVAKYRREGVAFSLLLPREGMLKRLFLNCGWAGMIDPAGFPGSGQEVGDNILITPFATPGEQKLFVDKVMSRVLARLDFLDRRALRAIEWSVNELTDNVLNHSRCESGGLGQLNLRRKQQEIEIIVADSGIGIPESFRLHGRNWSDEQALEQSIREGVTSVPDIGRGFGLYGAFQIAALSGGTFHINSGRAHLVQDRSGRLQIRRDDLDFLGTSVVLAINFQRPISFEEALNIRGKTLMAFDFIEGRYERDDATVNFALAEEVASTGSRLAGFEARRKVENIMRLTGARGVVIDGRDVGVLSSSFADEFFAKLALALGEKVARQRVSLVGFSPLNTQIIAAAIERRRLIERRGGATAR